MTIQTTSNLSNSIAAVYKSKYLDGAKRMRLYDQIAVPYTELGADGKSMAELMRGSSIVLPFLSSMTPGTTAISQTADVTPQVLVDATASVTPTSRWGALQMAENLGIQAYTDYVAKQHERVGENAMHTIENLAIDAGLAGTWVERAAARASLDAGTVSHRASDSIFRSYDGLLQAMNVPGYVDGEGQIWTAIMPPYVFHDIQESGNVSEIGVMAQTSIHLNWELGQIGRFRLLSSPYAKVFGAAGADNASNWSEAIAAAAAALATTISTTSTATNTAYGKFLWLGTEETSTTFYPTNEPVRYVSGASGNTVTVIGGGENGGLRWPHAVTDTMRNADSVYPVLFAGPRSLVKIFAQEVGEFGQVIAKTDGLLDQFSSVGWKFYGNYAVVSQNWLLRAEFSTSYEA